jgi:hypothetical protein
LAGPLSSDIYTGVSISAGWDKSGERSNASILYSPSYFRTVRNPDLSSLNHDLSLNWSTKLGAKWAFGASAAGIISNLQQLMFNPTRLGSASMVPATFDELAAAVLAGSYSNFQLASVLTGASALSSPDRSFLYGNRMLSTSAQITLSYAPSQRSSVNFGVYATRAQRLRRADEKAEASVDHVVPQTTAGGATFGWSYSLTPRTQVGAEVSAMRVFSLYQQSYVTRGTVSIGRTMSRRWFVQTRFGAGHIAYIRQTIAAPSGADYIAGGSIGYKTSAHTFMASFDRTVGDAYGIGAGSTRSTTGAWTWRRPGKPWSLTSGASHQILKGSVLSTGESWSASMGVSRQLGAHVVIGAQYGYFQFPAHALLLALGNRSQHGAVVSLTWSPTPSR